MKTQTQQFSGAYVAIDDMLNLRHIAKGLQLESRKKSSAIMDGDTRSHFRGRGMEFAEVRPYQAGDDIRTIDWRVTARTQKPYTKLFQEERERPVYIVVDQRSPMFFGSEYAFKSVYAAQLAAVVAWVALENNDRIGALIFSDTEQEDIRAKRGKHAVLALLHQVHQYNRQLNSPIPASAGNSLEDMLMDVRRVAKPGSSVFILSDFHDFNSACEKPLSLLSKHTDVTLMNIFDKLERQLPADINLTVTDTDKRINIPKQNDKFIQEYTHAFDHVHNHVRRTCQRFGLSFASIQVNMPIEKLANDLFRSDRKSSRRRS